MTNLKGFPVLVAMQEKEKGTKGSPVAPVARCAHPRLPLCPLLVCRAYARHSCLPCCLPCLCAPGISCVALFPPLLPPLLLRSGHKLLADANSRQMYFAGGCAPGISCVALVKSTGSQQQAKVLCWRVSRPIARGQGNSCTATLC
jgi:hypothetical protein